MYTIHNQPPPKKDGSTKNMHHRHWSFFRYDQNLRLCITENLSDHWTLRPTSGTLVVCQIGTESIAKGHFSLVEVTRGLGQFQMQKAFLVSSSPRRRGWSSNFKETRWAKGSVERLIFFSSPRWAWKNTGLKTSISKIGVKWKKNANLRVTRPKQRPKPKMMQRKKKPNERK